ncbi:CPBP family intramembrane glutamic endopeptidase [Planomicrobium sp. CPCC 101110]|uniref:CPBP family intramembrane glutamic endopeptidase n=1 Tax=Planomicrobium sp. CPCC 101110 TaxID=2599619 RepID=UPI0011B6EF9F|nr:CPBP family intramembrane glutamic endopeptidase [Planomicrobium sp. CPCC 101110]TWT24352.1 CPBP family intramembrane metalloprotease [Planomicrobium sp. CPCC 101110]
MALQKKGLRYFKLFLSIQIAFISYYVLKAYPYPDSFDFISTHYKTIDLGRKFYPKIDLIILFLGMIIFSLYSRTKVKEYLSHKPLKKFSSWVFISLFFLLIYLCEQQQSRFSYSLQLEMPSFTIIEYFALASTVVLIAPISEELVFRGPLLFLFPDKGKYLFLFVSTVWFIALHGNIIFGALFSLGLSFLTLKFRSLAVPILAHAIWNFFVMHN